MELGLTWKWIIFVGLLIVVYIVLRMNDIDILESIQEAFTEIEWNITAVILTLCISFIMWLFLWKTPWWATTDCKRFLCVTGLPAKIILTTLLPIVGYPLAVRALNRE